MRYATFTELPPLDYLCGLIPNDHALFLRFLRAEVMLAARYEHNYLRRMVKVRFDSESEVRDILDLLGYPHEQNYLTEQFIRLAEKLRLDQYKASRNFSRAINS